MTNPSLEYLVVLARTKNVTRAAEELYTSQQNLSAYIKKLEEIYGLPIFIRKPHFELTPFGEELYQYALQIQEIHEKIRSLAEGYQNLRELHLGCRMSYPNDFSDLFPLTRYLAEHPDIRLMFHEYHGSDCIQKLQSREVDFGMIRLQNVTIGEHGPLRSAVIANRSSYVLISRELLSHHVHEGIEEKIAKWQKGIALRELKGIPYFRLSRSKTFSNRNEEEEYLKIHGLDRDELGECFSRAGGLQMCRRSICYFVSGDPEPPEDNFFSFPVVEPDTRYQLHCLCHEAALQSEYGRDFWQMALDREAELKSNAES